MLSPRFVDTRGHTELQVALERAGFGRKALPAGDVQFPEAGGGSVLIEYKDVYQVLEDMASGQLVKQCRRMIENAEYALLMVGGPFELVRGQLAGKYTWDHLWDQLLSCQEYGVMLERCVDRAQAIQRILHLAERYAHETHSAGQHDRHPSGNPAVSVLSHVFSVGSGTAHKLLNARDGTLLDIAQTSLDGLQEIDGIGPKTAKRLFEFWRKDFRQP